MKTAYEFIKEKIRNQSHSMSYNGENLAEWQKKAREKLAELLGMDKFEKVSHDLEMEYSNTENGVAGLNGIFGFVNAVEGEAEQNVVFVLFARVKSAGNEHTPFLCAGYLADRNAVYSLKSSCVCVGALKGLIIIAYIKVYHFFQFKGIRIKNAYLKGGPVVPCVTGAGVTHKGCVQLSLKVVDIAEMSAAYGNASAYRALKSGLYHRVGK
jgi:hypothetical protein